MALAVGLASCAIAPSSRYPAKGDARPHAGVASAHGLPVHGVDISKWQGKVDWAALRQAGTKFAFIKATEGGDHVDNRFIENWAGAKQAGGPARRLPLRLLVPPGPRTGPCGSSGTCPTIRPALPPVLDVEWNGESVNCPRKVPREQALAMINLMLKEMEAHTGKRPIIYTDITFHQEILEGEFTDYPFWIRSTAAEPHHRYNDRRWTFWQFTTTGRVPGVSGDIDRNTFYGTDNQWRMFLASNCDPRDHARLKNTGCACNLGGGEAYAAAPRSKRGGPRPRRPLPLQIRCPLPEPPAQTGDVKLASRSEETAMIPNIRAFNFDLGETADAIRETVRDFAQDKIAPRAEEIDRTNQFPRDLWPAMGELGLHGITVEEEYGGAGSGYLEHVVAVEEVSRASASVGLVLRRAFEPLRQPDQPQRHRRAEAALPAEADLRRASRRACHVGAGLGLGRGLHAHPRREARRPLCAQRQQDVDHQRPDRRRAGGLRQDRSGGRIEGHHGLPDREGLQGTSRRTRSSTSSACAARIPANCFSRIARCRRRTCSARSAGASTC